MKKQYQQLTLKQRYHIQAQHEVGRSQKKIADSVNCNKSTISRELKRCPSGNYQAEQAHKNALNKRRSAAKATKKSPKLLDLINLLLGRGFSPAAIAGRIAIETGTKLISHETIYQWIYLDKREGGKLHKYLLRAYRGFRKSRRAKDGRGLIADRVSIDKRPEEANLRQKIGHWEGDTVHGKKGNVVTLLDRKTRFFNARKTQYRSKDQVGRRLIQMLGDHEARSLTVDNGREFYSHKYVAEKSGIPVYFADPYSSWQRGSNENANGILRRYFPKGSDFSKVSAQALRRVVEKINMMPRKLLNWKTAYEVHYGVSVALIT